MRLNVLSDSEVNNYPEVVFAECPIDLDVQSVLVAV